MRPFLSFRFVAFGGEGKGLLSHLEVLVRRLLVLLSHGRRRLATEGANNSEYNEAGKKADGSVEDNLPGLIRRGLGAGSVGTEGDPIGWQYVSLGSVLRFKTR